MSMKPQPFHNTHSHGDLHNLEIIEDRSGARRKHGLPTRYTKGRFLGKGGFAKCYEVQDMETREIFAAKIVAKASISKPRAHAKLKSEIAIHRSLNHDKVVKFHDHFEDSDYVYIILELCPNQTLNEFMRKRPNKRLSEPEAMFYIYDLIVALKYLHRRRVIHRDLKLGNLFLDADVRLKVGDFGLAAQLEHDSEKRRTICGTPNYIAPEILEGRHGHSYEVDIWSLGVILYTMIIGRPPFETSDVRTTYRRIRYNQYSYPDSVRISDPAKELIDGILRTEPHSRLSLDEILGSTWFASQRLPPPVPGTVAAFTITPRVGSSSARSETPERGAADFARIDSPVPRFPLRDRSPSVVSAHNVAGPQQPLPRGQSASPLMPTKQPPAPPSFGGAMTPGRYTGGLATGRPPLAHRGNEENVVPVNTNMCGNHDGIAYATPMSPKQILGSSNAVPCRPQSAHLASCGNSVRAAPSQPSPQVPAAAQPPSAVPRGQVVSSTPRDSMPAANTTAQVQAKLMGFSSARSTTCSPRQPPAGSSSSRPATGVCTPKENRSRSARALGSSTENGTSASNLHTKTTPLLVRSGTQPLSSRNPGVADSPNPSNTQHLRATQQFTPCCGEDIMSARTPLATPTSAAYERRHLPVQNCPSPALTMADGALRDVCLEPPPWGVDPFGEAARSSRSTATHTDALGSGHLAGAITDPAGLAAAMPELWVVKWVDYSSKYGVGYILSDGSIGVYFNDSTKIVLTPEGTQFDYVTRRTQEKPEIRTTHTFEDYPEDLKKKVTLLRHFKNYMHADVLEKKDGATVGESGLPPAQQRPQLPYEPGQVPYVKKWTRNKHAIMFQLSNKIVQVVFFDKTEAVLSSKSHTVTYVDKRGQVCSYPLSNVLDVPSPELAKRLRYTKDILVNLLGTRTNELPGVH